MEVIGKKSVHAQAQLLVLKIGRVLAYDTYSPARLAKVFGERLSHYITLDCVPTRFLGPELISLVEEIDVIWFTNGMPRFAFEIEHSKKFGNAFRRLCQLYHLSTRLFIISSDDNHYIFDKFVNTDPYYKYKASFCFRNYKQLEDYFRRLEDYLRSGSEIMAIDNAFLVE